MPEGGMGDAPVAAMGVPMPLRGWAPEAPPKYPTRWPLLTQTGMVHEQPDVNGCLRLQRLGEGAYGVVYKALNVRDQHAYALKEVSAPPDVAEILYERAVNHKDMMSENDHIVRYYDVYYTQQAAADGLSRFSITMDYASEGDLTSYLRHTELSEKFIVRMTLQVLDALMYMGSLDAQYIHMDIKPENILVFGKGDLFKLCDFDACRQVGQVEISTAGQDTTEEYKAPEVANLHFTSACDVFSLGVVLYLISALPDFPVVDGLMLNHPSFADHSILDAALAHAISEKAYLHRARRGKQVQLQLRHYTDEYIGLVSQMLQHDFEARPSVQTCYDLFFAHFEKLRRGKLKPRTEVIS
eukprot:TRINITY_DN25047_c0_g1_i1.p1 TRINITY_DN25047_c0_g1~~TRINITY_DN25047_c0_g1_i1.p1  ORF type:complete len:355 (+),score=131.40 TRINITY_DN25047_c0_g1_i1:38-1102(+)